ncbi:hypothetical protein [Actinomadura chibensis]|uniref:hypothetical protein n=1 Tax=Actinomadura chibensis TaxID=392828 RepID=UPI00082FC221|nr:hypothetical protein [Actinomadura chibensis]
MTDRYPSDGTDATSPPRTVISSAPGGHGKSACTSMPSSTYTGRSAVSAVPPGARSSVAASSSASWTTALPASNGFTPSSHPATAVAYSHIRNCAPSGAHTEVSASSSAADRGLIATPCTSGNSPRPPGGSNTTTPRPRLPVPTARSWEIQAVSAPGPRSSTLSRARPPGACCAQPPRTAPSSSPGLSSSLPSDGTSEAASSSSRSASAPASTAGTSPYADSAP